MAVWIEASVSVLRCEEGHTTRYLIFHGETDMVTAGLASLSSVSKDEIVVSELEPTEFTDETGLAFQLRTNQSLGRHDLRFVRLRRVESNVSPGKVSFQDFRKEYSPPDLIFACSQCGFGWRRNSLQL
jgi:hypothetical protein